MAAIKGPSTLFLHHQQEVSVWMKGAVAAAQSVGAKNRRTTRNGKINTKSNWVASISEFIEERIDCSV